MASIGVVTNTQQSSSGWDATYKWLLAWIVAIVILTLINKTRVGHVFIYYWLWLLILFLFVTQYQFMANALEPLGTPVPQSVAVPRGGNSGYF
jgi:hypothetical protein